MSGSEFGMTRSRPARSIGSFASPPRWPCSWWRVSPAYVSYWHAYAVVRAHGESAVTARLEPATIDGLVYASSLVILCAVRHGECGHSERGDGR
jgi:hypothetical protein